jgi:hypothetical protein
MGIKQRLLGVGLTLGIALGGASLVLAQEEEQEGMDPKELFASAKESLDGKKYGKTLQDLQLLVGTVQKLRIKQIKGALPNAPQGWAAEDPKGDATGAMFLGGGITVKRMYYKGEQGASSNVSLELVTDSPMVTALAPMLTNPAFFQGQEGMTMMKVKGKNAIVEWRKGEKNGTLKMLLNNNTTLLTLQGNEVDQKDVTDTFAKNMDLAAIEKVLQE